MTDKLTSTASKVAQVTLAFWIMKILATTLGETAGDFISMTLHLGYYVGFGVTFTILIALLVARIRFDRYRPALFWAAIIADDDCRHRSL